MISEKIESLIAELSHALEGAQKIDSKEYGWKAACPRVRKSLLRVARECGQLRKDVQSAKEG